MTTRKPVNEDALLGRQGPARAAILAATEEALEHRGYRNARLEDIATRAGVSRQTIYSYFGDRDGVIRAFMAEESIRFADALRTSLRGTADTTKALVEAFNMVLEFMRSRNSTSDPLRHDFVVFSMTKAEDVLDVQIARGSRVMQEERDFRAQDCDAAAEIGARLLFSVIALPGTSAIPTRVHAENIARAVAAVLR